MPPFLCTSGEKQFKPQQTLLLAPFCHSPVLLEQGLQTLVSDISPAGGSLSFISSSRPHGPTMLAGMGLAWGPARASRLGEAGGEQPGSGKWLRKSQLVTPPWLVLSGAWLEAPPSVGAPEPPQRLVEARGTSLQRSSPASTKCSHFCFPPCC